VNNGKKAVNTLDIWDALFAGIKSGRSTKEMCAELSVTQRALWGWLSNNPDLMDKYLNAKECAAHARIEEIKRA
jgi:hypothetical protein